MTQKLILVIVLLASAGCVRRLYTPVCEWPAGRNTTGLTLEEDVRFAEDLAIRFADGKGYRDTWRATREECEATLFAHISQSRGATSVDVAAARAALEQRGFDWLVNMPMAAFSVLIAWLAIRWIQRRFNGETLPQALAVFLVSVVIGVVVVVAGQLWSGGREILRIGNGHMSYRARRIPWGHHRMATFLLAILTVWAMAALRVRHNSNSVGN